MLRAHFGLPTVESEEGEGRPPIKVQFEIPYFTTSGIQVHITHNSVISDSMDVCGIRFDI